jgi:hypothetical protein
MLLPNLLLSTTRRKLLELHNPKLCGMTLFIGYRTKFPLDSFALLYFAFSLSFFQREGCP